MPSEIVVPTPSDLLKANAEKYPQQELSAIGKRALLKVVKAMERGFGLDNTISLQLEIIMQDGSRGELLKW